MTLVRPPVSNVRASCDVTVCRPRLPTITALAHWLSGVAGRSRPWTENPPPPGPKIKQTFRASFLAFKEPDPTFSNITLPLPSLTDEGSKVETLNDSSALGYTATKQETAGSTAVLHSRISSHLQNNLIVYIRHPLDSFPWGGLTCNSYNSL